MRFSKKATVDLPPARRPLDFYPLEERVLLDGTGLVDEAALDGAASGEPTPEAGWLADWVAAGEADPQRTTEALDEPLRADLDDEQADALPDANDDEAAALDDDTSVRTEMVFVDAAVEDAETLLDGLRSQNDLSTQWHVVYLDGESDGVEQITEALRAHQQIDAVHILSHGDGSGLALGNSRLDLDSAAAYAGDLASWGSALTSDADLLIYGCELAATADGKTLIDMLAAVTESDVAASDDATGHSALGGDWDLEYRAGLVTTDVAIDDAGQQEWDYLLNTAPTVTHSMSTGTFTEGDAPLYDPFATVSDPDSANFGGGTYTLTITSNGTADDRLGIRNVGTGAGQIGISGSNVTYGGTTIGTFGGGTDGSTPLVVSLNANASLNAVRGLVRAATYANVSEDPTAADRTIQYSLTDGDGGTSAPSQVTVSVVPVNDVPTTSDHTITMNEDNTHTFSAVDFDFNDVDGTLDSVQITRLETVGSLQLSGVGVTLNQVISKADIDAGNLTYTPVANANGAGYDRFDYRVSDGSLYSANTSVTTHLAATFDADFEGFVYEDIANGGWVTGAYDGAGGASGGGLTVQIGGGATGATTTGGWTDTFTLSEATEVTISTDYRMVMDSEYEVDEYGELFLRVNGVDYGNDTGSSLVHQVGDGNAGPIYDTGWQTYETTITLGAGTHTLQLITSNNKSSEATEVVTGYFDNVSVTTDRYNTVTVDVTAVNDAPVLDNSGGPYLTSLGENTTDPDGDSVADVVLNGSITDADGSAVEAFAVTNVDNSNGTWQYSLDNGSSWNDFGTPSDNAARLLDPTDRIRFVPDAGYDGTVVGGITYRAWDQSSGSSGAVVDTTSNGGSTAFSAATESASIHVVPSGYAFWFSTEGEDGSTGWNGVSNVRRGDVIGLGNPTLDLEPGTTGGTFSRVLDAATFAGDGTADIDGLHLVSRDMTVGSGLNAFDLMQGDLLFSTKDAETFTSTNSLAFDEDEIIVFRPDTAGDYSSGTFSMLLDEFGAVFGGNDVRGVTLVERDTSFGDTTLQAGAFLFSRDGGAEDENIYLFNPTGVGAGTTAGSVSLLIDSDDLGNGSKVYGLELIEEETVVGGVTLSAGQLLVTLDGNDASVGTNSLSVKGHDVFYLDVTQTTMVSGTTAANATLLIEGADANLNTNEETTDALALVNTNLRPTVDLPTGPLSYSEGGGNVVLDASATVKDLDSTDFEGGVLQASFAAAGTANDRLAIKDQGTSAGQVGVSGSNITYGGVIIGAYSGGSNGSDPLRIVFNALSDATSVQAVTRAITYANVSDAPSTSPRTVEVIVSDGDGGTSLAVTKVVNLTAINDAPAVSAPGSALSATEQVGLAIHGAGFTVSDADEAGSGATAEIRVGEGTLSIAAGDSGITIVSGNNSDTVMVSGTIAQLNNLLTSAGTGTITYTNNSNTPSASTTVTVTVNDGGNTGADPGLTGDGSSEEGTASQTINIAARNDDPTNAGSLPSDLTVTEDTSSDVDLSQIDLSDVDHGGSNLTVELRTSTGGNLSASTGGGVTVTDSGSGTLTLTGTQAALNAFLDTASNIQYLHGTAHLNGNDADTITVIVNDGGNTGSGGGSDINLGTVNVDITAVNDNPVNTVPGTQTVAEETTTAIGGISIADLDAGGANLTTRLRVTNGVLNVTLAGSATISSGANGSADLTIQGSAADINSTLASLTYQGNADVVGTAADTLTVTTDDGGNTGTGGPLQDSDSVQIDISTVNDAPVVSAPGSALSATEQVDLAIHGTGFTVSDVDEAGSGATATISVGEGTLSIAEGDSGITISSGNNTGTVTLIGTVAQLNNLLTGAGTGTITYTNASDDPSASTTVTVTVNDGGNTGADPGLTGDGTSEEGTASQTINVTAVNDEESLDTNAGLTLSEGATATISNTLLSTSDLDNTSNQLVYTVGTIPGNGVLRLNSAALSAGQTFTQADVDAGLVDYVHDGSETTSDSFAFTVDDGAGTTSSGTFNITVTPVNDYAITAIADNDATIDAVQENSANGSVVGITAFADDTDGPDTVTYALDDNAGGRFAIDANTGVVTVAGGIDREAAGSYDITVRATSSDASTTTRTFTVSIGDVDEYDVTNPVDADATASTVDENAANGTAVGVTATASDADATTNGVSYTLADDAGGRFAIDASTGVVTVADGSLLDREAAASHDITVRASSVDGSTADTIVTINLNDVDEFDAVLLTDSDAAGETISEDATIGSAVGLTAQTSDADATTNTITYTLDDDAGGLFGIDAGTGEVTVNAALDYETATSHSITVRGTSADGSSVFQSYTITISDVDEADVTPISDSDAAADWVMENASVGTTVGTTAYADDADGTDTVSYSLVNDAGGRFAIDATTGVVTVAGAIDREAAGSYDITVRATSTDASSTTRTFAISIGDVDEFVVTTPSDSDGAVDAVNENAANGTAVGITATANDADATTSGVTYSLTDDAGGRFAVDLNTGVVTVADGSLLDREATASHDITVRATSADGSTAASTFTINLNDLDEFDAVPLTDSDAAAETIAENAAIGSAVGLTAQTSDADATTNTITYTLDDDAGGLFAIDAGTGEVTVNGSFDYETATSHSITVRGSSADGSSVTQSYTIAISDVNEAGVTPISDSDPTADWVLENASVGATVGTTVFADDVDGTDTVSYSLDNDAGGRFAIDATTGVVTVAGAIDREAAGSYDIAVRATSTDASSTTRTITISVGDLDEFDVTPPIDGDGSVDAVDENAANGTTIGVRAAASDADATTNGVTYSLTDDAGGRFSVDPTTGVVTVADGTLLDFESGPSHDITIQAASDDGSVTSRTITITLNDLNDNAPILVNNSLTVSEGQRVTLDLSDLNATDADSSNLNLTVSGVSGGQFERSVAPGVAVNSFTLAEVAAGEIAFVHDGSETVPTYGVTVDDLDYFVGPGASSITFNPTNDAPVVVLPSGTIAYTENDGAALFASSALITDSDDSVLTSVTVELIGYQAGQDLISLSGASPLAQQWDSGNGRFTLTGVGTVADYQAALRNLAYENTSDNPLALARAFRVVANDGMADSIVSSRNLSITPVNDAPIAVVDTYTIRAGEFLHDFAPGVLLNDVDLEGDGLATLIVSPPASGNVILAANGELSYLPIAGFFGTDVIQYRVSDGTDLSAVSEIQIQVVAASGGGVQPTNPTPTVPTAPEAESGSDDGDASDSEETDSDDQEKESDSEDDAQASKDSRAAAAVAAGLLPTAGQGFAQIETEEAEGAADGEEGSGSDRAAKLLSGTLNGSEGGRHESGSIRSGSAAASALEYELMQEMLRTEVRNSIVWSQWDQRQQENLAGFDSTTYAIGAVGASAGMVSVGYAMWAIRSGVFAATMFSSLPTWRLVDPAILLKAHRSHSPEDSKALKDLLD